MPAASAHERVLQKLDLKKLTLKMLLKENPTQRFFEVDFSHREHFSYGLLEREVHPEDPESIRQCEQCITYTFPDRPETAVSIRQRKPGHMCIDDFQEVEEIGSEIDYTGSVCVWPSEEILGYWLVEHAELFRGKHVCELGAGSGMAGIMLGRTGLPSSVCLTDGNPTVVRAIRKNITINEAPAPVRLTAEELLWAHELAPQFEHMRHSFDCVVAADCTVNVEIHEILVCTLDQILKQNDEAFCLYLAPRRGKSLSKFVKAVKAYGKFVVEVLTEYDDKVLGAHRRLLEEIGEEDYDHKKNYPLQVTIRRKPQEEVAREHMYQVHDLFNELDTNHDGKLDKSELRSAIYKLCEALGRDPEHLQDRVLSDQIQKTLQECDRDESGTIEFDEFFGMCGSNPWIGLFPAEDREAIRAMLDLHKIPHDTAPAHLPAVDECEAAEERARELLYMAQDVFDRADVHEKACLDSEALQRALMEALESCGQQCSPEQLASQGALSTDFSGFLKVLLELSWKESLDAPVLDYLQTVVAESEPACTEEPEEPASPLGEEVHEFNSMQNVLAFTEAAYSPGKGKGDLAADAVSAKFRSCLRAYYH